MVNPKSKIQNPKSRRGFTLIELMVVILILAILAALIIPRVIGRTDDAKRQRAVSDMKTLSIELDKFKMDTDRYPLAEEGLDALRRQPTDVQNWRGPYITKDVPLDPWGGEYVYDSDGRTYTLVCYGADKAEGGEGNDEDIVEGDAE